MQGRCDHSLPLLLTMAGKEDSRSGAGYSASVINGCPRQYLLAQEIDYYESPAAYYNRWRGDMMHLGQIVGSPHGNHLIQEVRLFRPIEVDGIEFTVSGQPDEYNKITSQLTDHKSTNRIPTAPYPEHERQINIYTWLLEGAGYHVESARIHYFDMKREQFQDVQLWDTEAVEAYIRRRLKAFALHEKTGDLPGPLPPDESWKANWCVFAGTGRCCMEAEVR